MSISPSFDAGASRIRLKTAEDKVKAFESGEKYVQMQEQFKAAFREHFQSRQKKDKTGLSGNTYLSWQPLRPVT